jgi:hypothetical protein|tara:strand:- start:629 stop:847 length:219 start_codon:yes stop_codon:yes gene_type:complete
MKFMVEDSTEVKPTKICVKEITFKEGDDTRVYLSNNTQLVGVTSVKTRVSVKTGMAEYTITGTIHNVDEIAS